MSHKELLAMGRFDVMKKRGRKKRVNLHSIEKMESQKQASKYDLLRAGTPADNSHLFRDSGTL